MLEEQSPAQRLVSYTELSLQHLLGATANVRLCDARPWQDCWGTSPSPCYLFHRCADRHTHRYRTQLRRLGKATFAVWPPELPEELEVSGLCA